MADRVVNDIPAVAFTQNDVSPRNRVDDTVPAGLFPLVLTPFEQYLMLDDSPQHPMTAFMQVTLATPLNVEFLEEAVYRACVRNPLYASRVTQATKAWQWHYDAAFRPKIRSIELEPPVVDGFIVPIDLTQEPGIRVWYHRQADDTWRLLFQFHHACADGIGMRRFVIDTLICYARFCIPEDDPLQANLRLDRLDHARLLERGSINHLVDTPAAVPLTLKQRLWNTYYFLFLPPAPLRGTLRPTPNRLRATSLRSVPPDQPTLVKTLSLEESTAILERARLAEVGLNDLGLALLFHQCRLWHEQHSTRGTNRRIRLLMPYDIRTKEDLRLSAANRLSYAFLGRKHRECHDWPKLLASVQAETQQIKDTRVYVDFLQGLSMCQRRPRLFRWVLGRMRHVATAVFTYGGDANRGVTRVFATQECGALRVGDALMLDGAAAPPVRLNTNIAIGFCISRDRISMSLSWSRHALSIEEAQLFFDSYLTSWKNWAQNNRP
ncbi:MAG: hypothetical protein IT423_24060 [Pirellulaceae bacterium]|nr:hypothetical protein [Pirellulaceae bacterium]